MKNVIHYLRLHFNIFSPILLKYWKFYFLKECRRFSASLEKITSGRHGVPLCGKRVYNRIQQFLTSEVICRLNSQKTYDKNFPQKNVLSPKSSAKMSVFKRISVSTLVYRNAGEILTWFNSAMTRAVIA